jgi:hypothetical protein
VRRLPLATAVLVAAAASGAACVGTTGGNAVDFVVAAAGPAGAVAGQPLTCTYDSGWSVTLTQAALHIGGLYLDQSKPVSGGQATGCTLTGTYVAQETSALDVDLLSPEPQPFPSKGHGITDPVAQVGQIWLTRGSISDVPSSQPVRPVLAVAGAAVRGGTAVVFPFTAAITIEANHQATGATTAGSDPICKERIVSPIEPVPPLQQAGSLLVRIDPCRLFDFVDFSALPAGTAPGTYQFSDDPTAAGYAPTGSALYSNLRTASPELYGFSWAPEL